ncbi:helix-turn-helix domain-containing protein [Oleiharenicola lentus]|uniref:helix-turn-helix domain-containing protein n=1 Tax=Oleiharenicola lentus TaxID=2508720 RepID=UPI003F670364
MFDPRAQQPIEVKFPACGIFVLESHHARGFQMSPVRHDFWKLIQPFSGHGWLVRSGRREPLHPSDVVMVPAGEQHHIEDDGPRPLSLYALCVSARALTQETLLPETLRAYRHFPSPVWSAELRSLIRHLLHEQTLARTGSELMRVGLAFQALGIVTRAADEKKKPATARTDQPTRARIEAYVETLQHTFYRRHTVDNAAASLGLSRRHFTQLFREVTGESWLATLQKHRLAHARRLLRESDRSVLSIGYECGFEDITTFYRAFKAAERTSPLAWRRGGAETKPAAPRKGTSAARPQRQKIASSTPN